MQPLYNTDPGVCIPQEGGAAPPLPILKVCTRGTCEESAEHGNIGFIQWFKHQFTWSSLGRTR